MLVVYESTVGEVQRGKAARLHSLMPAIVLAKSVLFSGDGRIIAVGGDCGNSTVLYRNCGMDWVQIGQTFRLDLIGSVISEHYNVVDIVCTNRNDFHIPRKGDIDWPKPLKEKPTRPS